MTLFSLKEFTDVELDALVMAAARRTADEVETSRAWRRLWHELAVLGADERDRRVRALHDMDRDAAGLVDADEVGGIVAPGSVTLAWSADGDPAALRLDQEMFGRFDGPDAA